MTMQGTHRARAREWALGHSSNGNEQVAVLFEITQGEHQGRTITWFGFFTDKTAERTLDSLRHCGWDGDDFVNLTGLDANEVELVIAEEEYQGKFHDRVQWVNRPASLSLKAQMNSAQMAEFAQRMRGFAVQHRQKYGAGAPRQAPQGGAPRGGQSQGRPAASSGYGGGYGGRGAQQQGGGFDTPPPSDDDIPF